MREGARRVRGGRPVPRVNGPNPPARRNTHRTTREHADVRQGSSVRGAIDLTLVAGELLGLRGVDGAGGTSGDVACGAYEETVLDAMMVALSGRIHLDETADTTPEQVLRDIWTDHLVLSPTAAAPG